MKVIRYFITMISMQLKAALCLILVKNENTEALEEINACQEEYLLLGTSYNEANVIDVSLGLTVYLKCGFCEVNTILDDKIWFFKQRGENDLKEISIGADHYKIWIDDEHTLQLINFGVNDSGIYICKSRNAEDNDTIFTYVLDGTLPANTSYVGTLSQWQEYKNTILDPINELFEKSIEEPFFEFKQDFKFSFRLFTLWENWGPCIANNNQTMVRSKIGKCFLYPFHHNASSNYDADIENKNEYYLNENYDVPCNSIKLREILPSISEIVRSVPQYKAVQDCKEIPSVASIYKPTANKVLGNNNDYVYTNIKQIAENGHVTLVCPDVFTDSDVQWFKDNELLGSSFRNNMAETEDEPHLTIDSYNSLYILHATKNEEGIYTCFIDNKKVQNYTLRVVSKSKLLNDDFVRYSIYLCFVLSISLVCYCTGICVAWNRRSSFADPLNLLDKK